MRRIYISSTGLNSSNCETLVRLILCIIWYCYLFIYFYTRLASCNGAFNNTIILWFLLGYWHKNRVDVSLLFSFPLLVGTGEFLEAWLDLINKMVNTKMMLETTHSLPAQSTVPGYVPFDTTDFLFHVHKVSLMSRFFLVKYFDISL